MGLPEVHASLARDFGGSEEVQVPERGQAGQILQALVADARVVGMQAGQA